MKGSKLWMSLFVVVLVLSFTITTVGAQSQVPPLGEVDEDGDLVVDFFPQVDIGAAGGLPDFSSLKLPEESVGVEAVPQSPIGMEYVYTKYPTFKFSQDFGATKYRIEVYNLLPEPDVLVYTLTGSGSCSGGFCKLVPDLPLKPFDLLLTKGFYVWHVQSKTAVGWGGWSAPAYFFVLKNGFNSSFTTLDMKWYPVYGEWTITSAGYAKTKGETFVLHSAIEKHAVSEEFVYEVKMKHKDDLNASNRLYFQAYPLPLDGEKLWYDGYVFLIRNSGEWQFFKAVDGVYTQLGYGTSAYIKPYDWNKVTLMVNDPFMDFWINGKYIGYVSGDTEYNSGYVGFGGYSNFGGESFLVDYAKLEYTITPPYPWPWSVSADGQRDPAYEFVPTEATLGQDLMILP